MVGAAQPVLLDKAEIERGVAMRTMFGQKAEPSLAVAEQHEILAQHPHAALGLVGRKFGGRADWHPIAPQHLAARRTETDSREKLVILARQHGLPPSLDSRLYRRR